MNGPNGWARDTAHQLLLAERSDKKDGALIRELLFSYSRGGTDLARLHALCVLDGLNGLALADVERALNDDHPAVRTHAIRFLERFDGKELEDSGPFAKTLARRLVRERDPQVRMQLAYSLGTWNTPLTAEMLIDLLRDKTNDSYLMAAGLCSINGTSAPALLSAVREEKNVPPQMIGPLLAFAKQKGKPADVAMLVLKYPFAARDVSHAQKFEGIADLLDTVDRLNTSLAELLRIDQGGKDDPIDLLKKLHKQARETAADQKASVKDRQPAVRMLAHGIGDDREDQTLLASLLVPQVPDAVQTEALKNLGRGSDPLVARAW